MVSLLSIKSMDPHRMHTRPRTSTAALSSDALATRQALSEKVLLAIDRAAALPRSVLPAALPSRVPERPYRSCVCVGALEGVAWMFQTDKVGARCVFWMHAPGQC